MCAMCVVGRRRMCACVCVLSCTLKYSKFKSSVNCPLNAWVHEGWGGGGRDHGYADIDRFSIRLSILLCHLSLSYIRATTKITVVCWEYRTHIRVRGREGEKRSVCVCVCVHNCVRKILIGWPCLRTSNSLCHFDLYTLSLRRKFSWQSH